MILRVKKSKKMNLTPITIRHGRVAPYIVIYDPLPPILWNFDKNST